VLYWARWWGVHTILQTCVSFVPQRNPSVFHLNHESEMCVKEEYTITNIYWVNETMCILEYCVCSEKQLVNKDISLQYFFIISCEIRTVICTECVVVVTWIRREIYFMSAYLLWQKQGVVLPCILLKITPVSRLLDRMTYMFVCISASTCKKRV
jgi:hypothetical protein